MQLLHKTKNVCISLIILTFHTSPHDIAEILLKVALNTIKKSTNFWGPLSLRSYANWMYNYLCNQCLFSLELRVRIQLRRGVLDRILYDKVCMLLARCRWFSLSTPVFPTSKTDSHDITEIWLKVALKAVTLNPSFIFSGNIQNVLYSFTQYTIIFGLELSFFVQVLILFWITSFRLMMCIHAFLVLKKCIAH